MLRADIHGITLAAVFVSNVLTNCVFCTSYRTYVCVRIYRVYLFLISVVVVLLQDAAARQIAAGEKVAFGERSLD